MFLKINIDISVMKVTKKNDLQLTPTLAVGLDFLFPIDNLA